MKQLKQRDDGDDGVKIKLPERVERRGFVDEFTEG